LFSFNAKNFFGKKKAAVRVEQGDWSDKFSLDVAGSSGVVVCKYNDILYQVSILCSFDNVYFYCLFR
jgi:vacuolar protein sorting-associated protein 13A/C